MKIERLLLILSTFLFISCTNNSRNNTTSLLNESYLPSQNFSLNITRDTTLLTKNGSVIKIPAGSFESDSLNIKLEIKEALKTTDIVLAGLSTMSGSQSLSSGGMMYINAATGYNVSIKKELEVLIPTKNYNPDMNVFKGTDSDGKINWTDPQPLPNDSTLSSITRGEELFKSNCANCHKPKDDYTGPGLLSSTRYRPKQWIYDFVHAPAKMNDPYSLFLIDKWKPTIMTAFPNLENRAIDDILAFVEVSARSNTNFPNTTAGEDANPSKLDPACVDSCNKYRQALYDAENKKFELAYELQQAEEQTEEFFTLDRTIPVTPPVVTNNEPEPKSPTPPVTNQKVEEQKEYVQPAVVKATFYTVNIKTFGWFNIDILMKERSDCTPSELFVRLQGNYEADFQVMLIVPAIKAFLEGGKLNDAKQYGFVETNGKIPLPQNAKCYVIAFAEIDGKLVFGQADFFARTSQTIDIAFSETTKEGLADKIKALKLDGVEAEVNDSKKVQTLKAVEQVSSEAEKFKPKNCNCDFMRTDSARLAKK